MTYTFRNNAGTMVTVEARDEPLARHEAMTKLWGKKPIAWGDGEWQGFDTNDMDVTVDLEKSEALKSISISFMQQTGPGVYMPEFVDISVSDNGKDFRKVKTITNDIPLTQSTLTLKNFEANLAGEKARYVRVFGKNGQHGFLFTDEVIIY
jgi:hexosaminidase